MKKRKEKVKKSTKKTITTKEEDANRDFSLPLKMGMVMSLSVQRTYEDKRDKEEKGNT